MKVQFKKFLWLILAILIQNQAYSFDIIQTPSSNFNERIDKKTNKKIIKPTYIILHYTSGCTSKKAFRALSNFFRPVSAHYLIGANGKIAQLVDESKRAWHAGKSSWKKNDQLNSYSIGIEIVNPGFSEPGQDPCTENFDIWNQKNGQQVSGSSYLWYSFTQAQIKSVIALCKEIMNRYDIQPENILGHSDIAPGRKVDPGPLFPWQELAQHGIGVWYDENLIREKIFKQDNDLLPIGTIQDLLNKWGYKAPRSGIFDDQTKKVIQAFQMHFRPKNIDGIADIETTFILKQLLNMDTLQ